MSRAEAIINQYKKENTEKAKTNSKSTYDASNYFNVNLPEGVNEGSEVIRIVVSSDETKSPFEVIHVHEYKSNGKFVKYICPKHMDKEPCPMCETRSELYELGTDDSKQAAKKFNTREMYVVKIIKRDEEEKGIKFFRFSKSYDKQGILDKIVDLIESYAKNNIDLLDPKVGYDLTLKIARNSKGYPVVTSIIPSPVPSKLVQDDAKIEEYINDSRTWRDVFGIKTYDYLNIIIQGKTPTWSKELNTYIALEDRNEAPKPEKASPESIIKGTANTPKESTVVSEPIVNVHQIEDDEEDEDLPF